MMRKALSALLLSCCSAAWSQAITDPMTGAPIVIDPTIPPKGTQLVQLFLLHAAASLQGSHCIGTEEERRRLTLGDRLAVVLGEALLRNETQKGLLHGRCLADKSDAIPGRVIDTWQCELRTELVDAQGEFIADASVSAHFTRDTWSFVPGSVGCL